MNHNANIVGAIPGRNSSCPCGSRVKAKRCCLVGKEIFFKKPIKIYDAKVAVTNLANPNCIANFTNDCVSKISGEHYFSKSILKLINDDKVEIGGWPHNESGSITIPIKSLVVDCLCERHNKLLSPFDDTARLIFKALIEFSECINKKVKVDNSYRLFNFWDFERWLIKTLVMASEAGFCRSNGMVQKLPIDLKQEYLNILFKEHQLGQDGAGFYFINGHDEHFQFDRIFDFNSNTSTLTNQLDGCTVSLGGFKFVFSARKLLHIAEVPVTAKQFRPWRFVFGEGPIQPILDFSVKPGNNETVHVGRKA
jgi:hypothetical protein